MRERGLEMPFSRQTRADRVQPELLDRLARLVVIVFIVLKVVMLVLFGRFENK